MVLAISFARAGCRIRGYATTKWTTVLHLHKFPFKTKRKENRNNQQGEEEKKRMVFKLAAFPSDSDKKWLLGVMNSWWLRGKVLGGQYVASIGRAKSSALFKLVQQWMRSMRAYGAAFRSQVPLTRTYVLRYRIPKTTVKNPSVQENC